MWSHLGQPSLVYSLEDSRNERLPNTFKEFVCSLYKNVWWWQNWWKQFIFIMNTCSIIFLWKITKTFYILRIVLKVKPGFHLPSKHMKRNKQNKTNTWVLRPPFVHAKTVVNDRWSLGQVQKWRHSFMIINKYTYYIRMPIRILHFTLCLVFIKSLHIASSKFER